MLISVIYVKFYYSNTQVKTCTFVTFSVTARNMLTFIYLENAVNHNIWFSYDRSEIVLNYLYR